MTELRWGPTRGAFLFGGLILSASGLWLFYGRSAMDRIIGIAVILLTVAFLLAGIRVRQRLTASSQGVVVGTLKGPRSIPWHHITRLEVVRRRRWGSMSAALELDVGDEELFVFSRMDLGTEPEQVAAVLQQLRAASS